MWENLGPMHVDRCRAVSKEFKSRRPVIAIELAGRSDTYQWRRTETDSFERVTLFPDSTFSEVNPLYRTWILLRTCINIGPADLFFCHYEYASTFFTAIFLRILGRRVFVMNDSKFDDKPRRIGRELFKRIYLVPYKGALAGSKRSAEYFKFFGFSGRDVVLGYDTMSIERIKAQTEIPPAPDGLPFDSRHFTVIARLVEKKNLFSILHAFVLYAQQARRPRTLHLCGSGPLEAQLREKVKELGVAEYVIFRGLVDTAEISRTLGQSLALILASTEEQFGLVVIEAQAMGIPIILTPNCGARDELVRTGVNGFLVEADNPIGMAYFMHLLSRDELLWQRLASNAKRFVPLGDCARFADGCVQLMTR